MFSKTANMLSVQECQFSETANCLCSLRLWNVFLEHLHHTCCENVPTFNSWMSTGAPISGKKQQWQIILERECSRQEILNVGGVTTYPKTNCNEFRKNSPWSQRYRYLGSLGGVSKWRLKEPYTIPLLYEQAPHIKIFAKTRCWLNVVMGIFNTSFKAYHSLQEKAFWGNHLTCKILSAYK